MIYAGVSCSSPPGRVPGKIPSSRGASRTSWEPEAFPIAWMCGGITIRTIVMKNGKAYIQAGAGIVADSQPALEFKETVNKARAMIKAIKLAEQIN